MKKLLFVAAMLIAASSFAFAQTTQGTSSPSAAVRQGGGAVKESLVALERQAWEAWKKKDGAYFQTFLSDDTVQVGSQGVTRKAQIVNGIGTSTCDIKGYTLDNFDVVTLNQDAAILTFSATQDATCGGVAEPSPVWASTVYVKRAGKWQAAFHQETPAQQSAGQQRPTEKKP
ncbi:MAG: nuclear transport factor 2 family protein [Acidobacteriota bacterium]|nr:nuclear transport factor 2 family protein [Acidobacteriota bacterium]